MSTTYPALEKTNFPDSIDEITRFSDPTSALISAVNQYRTAYNSGDMNAAAAVLLANPALDSVIFNADKMNILCDAIIALEQYYMNYLAEHVMNLRGNWNADTGYAQYDCVMTATGVYQATSANTNKVPADEPDYWTRIINFTLAIDAALSSSSENAVQNKVVYAALSNKANADDIPAVAGTITSSGLTPVTSAAIYAALALKANANSVVALDATGHVPAVNTKARIVSFAANKTASLDDAGTFQKYSGTSSATWTIPAAANVTFPEGTEIEICRWGSGTLTIACGSNVTMNGSTGSYVVPAQYDTVTLKKVDGNAWVRR